MNVLDPVDLARTFWLADPGQQPAGPYTMEQLGVMWRSGAIYPSASVCETETEDWIPFTALRRDYSQVIDGKRADAIRDQSAGRSRYDVSRYQWLGVLLGGIGAHNLYAGEMLSALGKLILFAFGVTLACFPATAAASWAVCGVAVGWALVEVVRGKGFEK